MDDGDDSATLLLCMSEAFANHEREVAKAHDKVCQLLISDAWKIAMRLQHYLILQCLDKPTESAWISLYLFGNDVNFLNATSHTRFAVFPLFKVVHESC
ncbi:hypothetical protein F442_16676 [Phytophthora nicotianae P10297]|uniref:Uncharacterized protein n=4 Tax=Phytophthora nicotianae TaxID=4792 RepID=V9EGF1_PHYNI|nr:hypothetical protein F443_16844 [Phytophthora nicotianae P1569]ETM37223.1 hypothetical protein L914_16199 [Phytophthora nicotianae]ETO65874.1 hypothetical protein F444_16861 [Phytophthora nicotianae P1976]ETP35079.1 hypothetical protein F442_16676 [Phytophthora nicotianae P10297]